MAEGTRSTVAGRIKIGMAVKGIKGPQELADAVNKVSPQLKLNRQTTAKWINGETINIEPPRLMALAHTLDFDPEWLAIGKGEPQRKGRVSLEHKRLIELYAALPENMRRAWMRSGDAMLEEAGQPSPAQPFKAQAKQ